MSTSFITSMYQLLYAKMVYNGNFCKTASVLRAVLIAAVEH